MVVCDLQLQMPGTAVLFWDERTKRDETAGWTPNNRGVIAHYMVRGLTHVALVFKMLLKRSEQTAVD
jgi:hypothetical protein